MEKWVSIFANAISIAENKPAMYSKNITLRHPVYVCADGESLRIELDNFTGVEDVFIDEVTVGRKDGLRSMDLNTVKNITFNNSNEVLIKKGETVKSDEIDYKVYKDETLFINIYLKGYTSLMAGTVTTGPDSKKYYAYDNMCHTVDLPRDTFKSTNMTYFLSNVEIKTEKDINAVICFGDSITAQDWPEFLNRMGLANKTVVRKAASGARMLRQYENIVYNSYGLKSDIRIEHDLDVAGADAIIIQQGINDIIHPVGIEVNEFRPMSDWPTIEEMIEAYERCIEKAKSKGLKVYLGTLLPIEGWRTYAEFRNDFRNEINEWMRNCKCVDGVIDFDKALRDPSNYKAFKSLYDSGDHLHPSKEGYIEMANTAYKVLNNVV